jgi:hypothetical protein
MKPSALSVLLVASLAILPQPAQGQRIASLTHFAAPEPPTRRYSPTYWVEGAVIGAGVLATTGVWIRGVLCDIEASDCGGAAITSALVAGGLGAIAGALVGGSIRAAHQRPMRGHVAKAVLLGATAGALWGFGVFPRFCLNGCSSGEVALGVSSAAVGALAGLVVGL